MGLFSFLGGLIGSGAAKKASRKAEAAQLDYLNRAMGMEQEQRTQDRADFAPFREFGTSAIQPAGDLLGFNGAPAQQTGIDAIRASPWYQALFRNGQEAVLQNASATGGIRGGNTERGLADFSSDTLATSIDRYLQQAMGAIGVGSGATTSGSAAGQNTANQIAQILGNQGQVRAGGLLTRGGINSQMWQNAGSFADEAVQTIMKAIGGGGF